MVKGIQTESNERNIHWENMPLLSISFFQEESFWSKI